MAFSRNWIFGSTIVAVFSFLIPQAARAMSDQAIDGVSQILCEDQSGSNLCSSSIQNLLHKIQNDVAHRHQREFRENEERVRRELELELYGPDTKDLFKRVHDKLRLQQYQWRGTTHPPVPVEVSSLGGPVASNGGCIGTVCLGGASVAGTSNNGSSTITGSTNDPSLLAAIRPLNTTGASMPFPYSTGGASSPPPASGSGSSAGPTTAMVSLGGGIFGKATYNPDGTVTVSNNLGTTTLTMAQVKQVAGGDLSPLNSLGATAAGNPNASKLVQISSLGTENVSSNTVKFTIPSASTSQPSQSTITGLGTGSPTVSTPAIKLNTPASGASSPSQSTITGLGVSPQSKVSSTGREVTPSTKALSPAVRDIGGTSANRNVTRESSLGGQAASTAAANAASRAASNAAGRAASNAAANAASRTASNSAANAASRAASNAAANAASRAASNVASRIHLPTVSDIRLKRDVAEVGQLPDGLHLYRFRYLWSDTVYVGVMAQEALAIEPKAVVRGQDGYLRVDYDRIGFKFSTWKEWVGRAPERLN